MRRKTFSRPQIIRLSRLLYMKYRPSEIAEVLEVNVHTIYGNYLKKGCPHRRDEKGYIWIIGTEFREWAENEVTERKNKQKNPMKENEGYCLKCNKRVTMVDPIVSYSGGNREIIQSNCPDCGTKVNRCRGIC